MSFRMFHTGLSFGLKSTAANILYKMCDIYNATMQSPNSLPLYDFFAIRDRLVHILQENMNVVDFNKLSYKAQHDIENKIAKALYSVTKKDEGYYHLYYDKRDSRMLEPDKGFNYNISRTKDNENTRVSIMFPRLFLENEVQLKNEMSGIVKSLNNEIQKKLEEEAAAAQSNSLLRRLCCSPD